MEDIGYAGQQAAAISLTGPGQTIQTDYASKIKNKRPSKKRGPWGNILIALLMKVLSSMCPISYAGQANRLL